MLLKVLDENRVKILMEDQDIEFYDLPFEKLNYEDPYSRAFIFDLFQKTYEQTGVDFKNCKVMIEVVPGVSRAYYILLSKMERCSGEQIEFDKADLSEVEVYVFQIDSAKEVFCFLEQLRAFFPQRSDLYLYNGNYYFVLSFTPHQCSDPEFGVFLGKLEEFGGRCKYRCENECILNEWGEHMAGPNAMELLKDKD